MQQQPREAPQTGGGQPVSPSRRHLLQLGACTVAGVTIAIIDRVCVAWQARRAREASDRATPRNIEHQDLLALLALGDNEFAEHAADFANRCSEFAEDPRIVDGCLRLFRIGMEKGGLAGDQVACDSVVGLGTMKRRDLLEAMRTRIHSRADLPRTRAAVADWLKRRF